MAKNSDQRAGGFETENTGGVLSGLLAEEEHLDRRAMFRLGTWGVVSVGAVIVAVLANQSSMKSRRDEIAALDLTRQAQQIQSVARESQNETRRLASAIDTLNGDRDRVYSRLTSLEQGLESVTGAIAKQNAAPSPAATSSTPTPAAAPQPVAQSAAPEPAPVVAPVMTVAAAVPEKSTSERSRSESKKSTQAQAVPVVAAPPAPSTPPPATSAMPLMASKSMMGPPDPAAGKLIEPEPPAKPVAAAAPTSAAPASASATAAPVPATPASAMAAAITPAPATSAAAAPAATPTQASTPDPAPEVAAAAPAADKKDSPDAAPAAAPQLAVKRTEFGVDVGGANSLGGLRALWRGLLKWRANAALAGLQPIIVVKESNNGLGMQLRLVAGPLTDAAAAAKICASMTINDRHCETAVYDGQRLALNAEDTPTTTESISAKPSPEKTSDPAAEKSASDKSSAKPDNRQGTHRRYSYSRRSAPAVEAPPPPPQTSSLSWFRFRSQ